MQFRVDNDSVVEHTNRLEKMHRSDFPLAVRGTLNSLAFDVKQNTMPKSAYKEFEERRKNFFKANSRVEMAKGWAVRDMESKVGFTSLKKNQAVEDLEQQERGGKIGGRSFITMDSARIGNNNNRMVSNKNRLGSIKSIVNTRNQKGKTKKERFVQAVLKAGVGGHVLGSTTKGENILWRVNGLSSSLKDKKFKPKLTPLYDYSKGREIKVDATHFMEKATNKTAKKGDKFYIEQAERRYSK